MQRFALMILVFAAVVAGAYYFFNKFVNKNDVSKLELQRDDAMINEKNKEGLGIEVLKEGVGPAAKNNDKVIVHYVGKLSDGKKFDSSLDRGQPFSFVLGAGQVIKGWEQGVLGMKAGEKRKLIIPPDLAYGDMGVVGVIPPKATLIFEVELLKIVPTP